MAQSNRVTRVTRVIFNIWGVTLGNTNKRQ
jgi:hypothetical protein